jgi:glycine/D-amino acid oxidase-like deaminating enzyme
MAPLDSDASADLVICGGGFTGLWAAIHALEESPGRRVTILEADTVGFGASTRNGGMLDQSLTHGILNGRAHWPDEIDTLIRLGRENFDELDAAVQRFGIDADYQRVASLDVATESWQLDELFAMSRLEADSGDVTQPLDAPQTRARLNSPTWVGGVVRHNHYAIVDPARLVWGLRDAAIGLGATVHDYSRVTSIESEGARLRVRTGCGSVSADRVLVATNAYRSPERSVRRSVIPVYDHVLMTDPLDAAQKAAIGWEQREGVDDGANQFHYTRLTADDRILWGGYDATYHFKSGVRPEHDQSAEVHIALAEHFFTTFPQLEGLRFGHRWGGPIGATSRFTCTWGTGHAGRLAWAVGYTGLGVAASRFGALVALDLVDGRATERTELEMVRRRPVPFPPEPLRSAVVGLTKRAIQRSDRRAGRSGAWLKLLGRCGVGFGS